MLLVMEAAASGEKYEAAHDQRRAASDDESRVRLRQVR